MSLEGYRLLGPRVKIKIIGGPAGLTSTMLERHLVHFVYRDEPKRHPTVTMQFDNSDGLIFNILVLLIGLNLKIRFGYENHMSRPFEVGIKRVKALALGTPGRSLTSPHPDTYGMVSMEGHAFPHTLKFRPSDDVWAPSSPMPLSRAVKQIARRYGYLDTKIFVQEGVGVDGAPEAMFDQSQIREGMCIGPFLRQKAKETGFVFSYTGNEFRWHSPGWKVKPTEVIEYFKGPDLLSYDIDGDYRINLLSVGAKAIDPKYSEKIAMQASTAAQPTGLSQALPIRRRSPMPSRVQPTDIVTSISSKAAKAAGRRFMAHVANKWKLKLTLVGNPSIFRHSGLLLANFGPIVDGLWYVKGVEHRVDNEGYTTTLEARKKPASGRPSGPVVLAFQHNKEGQPTGVGQAVSAYPSSTGKKTRKPRTLKPRKLRLTGK